jgi:hypothetical protein
MFATQSLSSLNPLDALRGINSGVWLDVVVVAAD